MARKDINSQRVTIITVYLIQILMMIFDIIFIDLVSKHRLEYIPILLTIVSVSVLTINFAAIDTNIFYNPLTELYEGDMDTYVSKNKQVLVCISLNLLVKAIIMCISYRLSISRHNSQFILGLVIVNIIVTNIYIMIIVLIKLWDLFYDKCLKPKPKLVFSGVQVNTYESFNF